MRILLTGGTGYIGSHVAALLLQANFDVVVVDNLCNSSLDVVQNIEQASGRKISFEKCDIRDKPVLSQVFERHKPSAVLHFAGLKAVGESVHNPLKYYENNVAGTVTLLQTMQEHGVHTLVFSSSATVYGKPSELPLTENALLRTENPYGDSKLQTEQMLARLVAADSQWRIACLRYFNPVGAHPSTLLGESPKGTPANLVPYLIQVVQGRLPSLNVFGQDYDTVDGTGVRDYIHVMDLAEGHLSALRKLLAEKDSFTVNLGTGQGYSVLEVIRAFERVNNVVIPFTFAPRRPGDVAACYADASLARNLLGWQAKLSLDDMCRDSWRYAMKAGEAHTHND